MLTTHYMDEAEALCDRVAIMDRGRILDSGAPAALVRGLHAPARVSIESGLVSAADANRLAEGAEISDDGVTLTISTREPGPVLSALAERALHGLSVRAATLEEVFLDLTGREYRE